MVYNWLNIIRRMCYPPCCVLCGQAGEAGLDLCRGCLATLPVNSHACVRCGVPLQHSGLLCGGCLKQPPPFQTSHIPFCYASPIDHLLQQLKFHRQLHLATLLGSLLAKGMSGREAALPEGLLPVPLHPDRLRERGYNQALELARVVSRYLNIPLLPELCQRKRATPPQTSLNGEERRRNLRGAFAVREGVPPRHIAIVDDVVTTGATVHELARVLGRAGVETVEVWACARAGNEG